MTDYKIRRNSVFRKSKCIKLLTYSEFCSFSILSIYYFVAPQENICIRHCVNWNVPIYFAINNLFFFQNIYTFRICSRHTEKLILKETFSKNNFWYLQVHFLNTKSIILYIKNISFFLIKHLFRLFYFRQTFLLRDLFWQQKLNRIFIPANFFYTSKIYYYELFANKHFKLTQSKPKLEQMSSAQTLKFSFNITSCQLYLI